MLLFIIFVPCLKIQGGTRSLCSPLPTPMSTHAVFNTYSCISGDFEKRFVKLQSPKRFSLHAISQYWNNHGLMQYVFGYNLCLNETSFIMLQYVGILIMQFNAE